MANLPTAVEDTHSSQCWECRRRRLVCDGTQPVCTKCRAARIVCPGYADKKPLTWLAPGQVLSRARNRKGARKGCSTKRDGASQNHKLPTPSSSDSGSENQTDELELLARDDPIPVELRPEVCDVFEAMMYYNSRIYPDLIVHQLGPNPFLIPMTVMGNIPPAIVHTLVSIAISHRIIQMAPEAPGQNKLVKPIWSRLYRHRDIALTAINKMVRSEKARGDLITVISVYTFLFAMLQQSFTPSWRTHVEGFMSLIHPHGSFPHILRTIPDMELSLMALWIVGTLANTTSPADKQFHFTTTEENLRLAQDFYTETYYPSVSLPPELFTEILLINDLRSQPPSLETTSTARTILSRIDSFSPESWSATPAHEPFQPDWLLISSALHASVALYAILSLQSSGALPISGDPELDLARARHARHLFALLEDALAAPRVRKRMTWPLIVAGVEAAGRASDAVQGWIGERLAEMTRDQGCAPPLVARGLLERFWRRGGGRWDECFGEGMAFVV